MSDHLKEMIPQVFGVKPLFDNIDKDLRKAMA
jgi:hypothetical protein